MQTEPHGPLHEAAKQHSATNPNVWHTAVIDSTGLVISGTTFCHYAAVEKVVNPHKAGWGVATYENGKLAFADDAAECLRVYNEINEMAA